MYLGSTGNMMQALDAATGDLIWENQVGPQFHQRIWRRAQHRDHGDKVFLATNNARLVAFDARTGKVGWETAIADGTKG